MKTQEQKSDKDKKKKIMSQDRHSLKGIRAFLGEVKRVSYTPGLVCFCTPGHNRGAAFRTY